jgi:hypothetical protein
VYRLSISRIRQWTNVLQLISTHIGSDSNYAWIIVEVKGNRFVSVTVTIKIGS